MKHTPGPWELMSGMPTNVLAGGLRVARCDFDGDFKSPEALANARLISAVTDLLASLKRMLGPNPGSDDREAAFAAIAKAEGR